MAVTTVTVQQIAYINTNTLPSAPPTPHTHTHTHLCDTANPEDDGAPRGVSLSLAEFGGGCLGGLPLLHTLLNDAVKAVQVHQ